METYFNGNRALWNEWTHINAASELYAMEAFKAGHTSLHEPDLSEVGPVQGKTLFHLQCHFGQDTLSWARLGAQVTGADLSDEAIHLANNLSSELNIPARFILSNLYDLPNVLEEQFDIVYTSYGVLAWLPDLTRWAQIAARFVRPGGFFYIAEIHPFAMVLDEESSEPRLRYPYFNHEVQIYPVQGSYANPSAHTETKESYEWNYPLGDVITALAQAGLHIEYMHEFPFIGYPMYPFLEKGEDGMYRLPGKYGEIPLSFSIRASKP